MLARPQLHPGTSCWQLTIDHGRNIYTMENGERYKPGFSLVCLFPEELRIKHLPAHHWGGPKEKGRRYAVAHGKLMAISLHPREVQRALEKESRALSSRLGFAAEGYRLELAVFICIRWPLRCYHSHN